MKAVHVWNLNFSSTMKKVLDKPRAFQDAYNLNKWRDLFEKEVIFLQKRAQEIGDNNQEKLNELAEVEVDLEPLDFNLIFKDFKDETLSANDIRVILPLLKNIPNDQL